MATQKFKRNRFLNLYREEGKMALVCFLLLLKREIKNVRHLQPISSVWRPLAFLPFTLSLANKYSITAFLFCIQNDIKSGRQVINEINYSFLIDGYYYLRSVQFIPSVMSDSLRPHEAQHTRPPCPSPTPGVHSNSRPSSQSCHPAISSSVVPFSSCPQSLPASESFPVSQLFA